MQHIEKREYMEALSGVDSGWIIRSMLDATPYMKRMHITLHKLALKRLFKKNPHEVVDELLSALAYHINTDEKLDWGFPMKSSARVCLFDAQRCLERGDYTHAIERARRGFEYLGYTHITRA